MSKAQNAKRTLSASVHRSKHVGSTRFEGVVAKTDDPIYNEGWHIHLGPLVGNTSEPTKPTPRAAEVQVTGFDFMANWSEEIRTIHDHGPFKPSELDELTDHQLMDYYYVTSWFLRLEGRESFVSHRQELRDALEKHWALP